LSVNLRFTGLGLALALTLGACQQPSQPQQQQQPEAEADELAPLPLGGEVNLDMAGGQTFRLADHPDDVKLLFFGYTTCPDVCPTTLARVSSVARAVGSDADHLYTVFVSIDPERDTPEKLTEFLSFFHVRGAGVTGPKERLDPVVQAYKAFYSRIESDSAAGYLMDHSTYVFLIDRQNRVRKLIRHDDSVEQIASWVKTLIAEKRS
jgi:protein SCO1